MSRQHVDYTTSALSPPNAPADDGLDTGSKDTTAIRPVIDGQPAQAAVFKRPSENLRTRTEKIRTELENLKYLADADRALLLSGPGNITWNFGTGIFTLTAATSLKIRPFLAPLVSSPSRLIICANTVAQVTFRTIRTVSSAPRAYSGANDISIDFQPVTTGTGAIVVTATGSPANNIHIQYDDHPVSGTTVDQIAGNSIIQQFNASAVAIANGVEAVIEGGGTPPEFGFPTPPLTIAASKIKDFITAPEQATRYMAGATDAEKHVIPNTHFTTFFAADSGMNVLLEGDTICIRYDDLVMSPTDGGRRQSIVEDPEANLTIPAGSLFLLRRFPERLPLAIPICTVADGKLIFINGRSFTDGETGPIVAAGASYQGSPANPNSWADGTGVAQGGPAITFELALDTIIQTLGAITAPSGAHKVGIPAIAGVGAAAGTFSTSAGGVKDAIAATVAGANAHINNPTAAHASTAIGVPAIAGSPVTITAGTLFAALNALLTGTNAHINNPTAAHEASAINNLPNGNVAAANVQDAVDELDAEKAGLALSNIFTNSNQFDAGVLLGAGSSINWFGQTVSITGTGTTDGLLRVALDNNYLFEVYGDEGVECSLNIHAAGIGPLARFRITPSTVEVGSFDALPLNLVTANIARWQVTAAGALAAQGPSKSIQNVLNPVNPQDAATKNYADSWPRANSQNYILNGDGQFWQRNPTYVPIPLATTYNFGADRWAGWIANATAANSDYYLFLLFGAVPFVGIRRNAGETNTSTRSFAIEVAYELVDELTNANFVAQPISLQFLHAITSNASGTIFAKIYAGTGGTFSLGGFTGQTQVAVSANLIGLTIGTHVIQIPAGTLNGSMKRLAVVFEWTPTSNPAPSVPNVESMSFRAVQLMVGNPSGGVGANPPNPVPYPNFAAHDPVLELEALQRYYEKSYRYFDPPGAMTTLGLHETMHSSNTIGIGLAYELGMQPRYKTQKAGGTGGFVTLHSETGGLFTWVTNNLSGQGVSVVNKSTVGFSVGNNTGGAILGSTLSGKLCRGHWECSCEVGQF